MGVVTPYRAQCDEIKRRLRSISERVRVGTAHAFQGGKRHVIVLSLVAGSNQPPRTFDWADHQPELWNVASTRARSALVVVGDQDVWGERGGVGGELLRTIAAGGGVSVPGTAVATGVQRLFETLLDLDVGDVELGVIVNGHRADAVVRDRTGQLRPILLDTGPPGLDDDPARHLRRTLQRTALLGDRAVRMPAWRLFTDPAWLRDRLTE